MKKIKLQSFEVDIEEERNELSLSRNLVPSKVVEIIDKANTGDIHDLMKLMEEIPEKDNDIPQNLTTRYNAVCKTATIISGKLNQDVASSEWAAKFKDDLDSIKGADGLSNLKGVFRHLMTAIYYGHACAQVSIINDTDTMQTGIDGFKCVAQKNFTLVGSETLLLRTKKYPDGQKLDEYWLRAEVKNFSTDLARAGMRSLVYLYVIKNLNFKDWLRALEKFGIPTIIASIDSNDYKKDRRKVVNALRNLGSDSGVVVSKNMDFTTLDGATGGFDAYEAFQKRCDKQISKIILGQTGTSDADNANRSIGNVHNLVRYDLLIGDAEMVADVINCQLFPLIAKIKYGWDAVTNPFPIPVFRFKTEPPTDRLQEVQILTELKKAGYEPADINHITGIVGFEVKKIEDVGKSDIIENPAEKIEVANA